MGILGQPKTFLRVGKLDQEEQRKLLEAKQEVWDNCRESIESDSDPFLRLSYEFLRDNSKTIWDLGKAWNLYTHLLAHANWMDSESCKWANLGEWFDAGFIVTVREQSYMAKDEFGCDSSTVYRYLRELEELGWIRTIRYYTYQLRTSRPIFHTSNVILLGYHYKVRDKNGTTKTKAIWLSELKYLK